MKSPELNDGTYYYGVSSASNDAYNPVDGSRNTQPARKEWWRPLAVLALVVVLVEWYIYNRRVYL